MGQIGNALDLIKDLENAQQGLAPGEPPPPPPIPFPTQQQLANVNLAYELPDSTFSGLVPIDQDKWSRFPPEVGWSQEGYSERRNNRGEEEVILQAEVPWGLVDFFRQFCLGYSWVEELNLTNGLMHREPPLQCPKYGSQHLYCSDCDLVTPQGYVVNDPNVIVREGDGTPVFKGLPNLQDGQGAQPPANQPPPTTIPIPWPAWADRTTARDGLALMRLTFRPRRYIVRSDKQLAAVDAANELARYVERGKVSALQSLPLPTGAAIFLDGPHNQTAIPTAGQFLLMPTDNLTYCWKEVPSPPWDAFKSCLGAVNANPFDSYALTGSPYPAGTLLCVAPHQRWEVHRQTTGLFCWDVYYTLLYRPQGWNSYPDADGKFYPVGYATKVNDVNKPIYPSADFDDLFRPGVPVQWD